jgi:hypothetical protein
MDALTEQRSMEWVHRVGEYRTLMGKRDQLGYPLGEVERARLEELELFFTACADPQRAPFVARDQVRAPIQLIVSFAAGQNGQVGSGWGEARDISGEGIYLSTTQPLPVGAHTVIRVIDRYNGDEWRFGAEVVRIECGAQTGMGLRFVGIPLSIRLGHRTTPPVLPRHLKQAA